ncbi:DUF3667 domain-containing protein [Sphingopyxis macrogoltabida]|uniref:DUF3667 domain-containing protein n=1 Tax=Sphingopyxis macrogoltabida TaxID=33050 RepID=A0AAC8Z0C1_SPHMC|nr:DUF3667 domain-containing protein [Sphingopyxis macrogoltabida]ALJ13309.1 hypothetical protein LH19_10560 [Sphingopyxis macrogoltabida]AMU89227.1 hypothetical protein ATM17_09275 [Sphingopyxis macrogoltabida]
MSDDCAHRKVGRYCPDCGKDLQPQPIDRRTVMSELVENWWERGVLHTLIGLFRQPGVLIRRYIESDRDILVKAVPYIAVALALNYGLRARFLPGSTTTELSIIETLQQEPLVIPLLSALISALVLHFIFYRDASAGLFGTMVMRLYILAQATLLVVVVDLAMQLFLTDRSIGRNLTRLAFGLGFTIFAVRQYYTGEGRGGWIRAIAAILCGELALILFVYMPAAMIEQAGLLD